VLRTEYTEYTEELATGSYMIFFLRKTHVMARKAAAGNQGFFNREVREGARSVNEELD
jgi:hypothetical protein